MNVSHPTKGNFIGILVCQEIVHIVTKVRVGLTAIVVDSDWQHLGLAPTEDQRKSNESANECCYGNGFHRFAY
jgi:hypothetical protein